MLPILRDTITGVASRRWFPAAIAVVAILVTLPAIDRGFKADDLIHRDLQLGGTSRSGLVSTLLDYFSFARPEWNGSADQLGDAPWWGAVEVTIAFFRPLAAFTHWLDFRLWPHSALLMHLQSILWYGLACFVISMLYRRFLGAGWIAGLSALLFAIDDAHMVPAEWIANRNVLIALVFGGLAIAAYDRTRRDGWGPGRFLGPVLFALSLLSAEAGVATAAYLGAYALCLDTGTWRRRLTPIVPYVAVALGWRLLYHALGFGAFGSDLYVDPGREPLRFLAAVTERAPVLLLGQLGWPDPILYNLLSSSAAVGYHQAALVFLVVATLIFLPLLRHHRMARFWALGSLLAVVPTCAMGVPSGRLLVFCGVGAMPLIVLLLAGLRGDGVQTSQKRVWRLPAWGFATTLLVVHGLAAPYVLVSTLRGPDSFQEAVERNNDFGSFDGAAPARIVIVNPPAVFYLIYYRSLQHFRGMKRPPRLVPLAPGHGAVRLTRTGERTLSVQPELGFVAGRDRHDSQAPILHEVYFNQILDRTIRGRDFPVQSGQRFDWPGLSAVVSKVDAASQPLEATLTFDCSLKDPSLMWVQWNWDTRSYEPFSVPPIGGTTTIAGPFASTVEIEP